MTTYSRTMGGTIVAGAAPVTEDFTRINGAIAGCGQAAMLVTLNVMKGTPDTPAEVGNLITQMVSAHQTVGALATSGESSPGGLSWLAAQYGVSMQSGDPLTYLHQYAGVKPIVWGVSNASAFGGSDSNVQGHYVNVVGKTADGRYIVSDPNTPESQNGQFVVYTEAQMMNAQPFWAAVPQAGVPAGNLVSQIQGGGSSSNCVHSISLFPGNTTCLDAPLDLLIRGGLLFAAAVLIILGIIIFGQGNPNVRQTVTQPVKGAAEAGKTLAGIAGLFA